MLNQLTTSYHNSNAEQVESHIPDEFETAALIQSSQGAAGLGDVNLYDDQTTDEDLIEFLTGNDFGFERSKEDR